MSSIIQLSVSFAAPQAEFNDEGGAQSVQRREERFWSARLVPSWHGYEHEVPDSTKIFRGFESLATPHVSVDRR
jgi:hypothetical protein